MANWWDADQAAAAAKPAPATTPAASSSEPVPASKSGDEGAWWEKDQAGPRSIDYTAPDDKVRAAIDKLPKELQGEAHDNWAEVRLDKLKQAGEWSDLPSPVEKIPVIGGLLDEATGALQAGLHAATGGHLGLPYEEGVALQRARSRHAEAEHPFQAILSDVAGGAAVAPLYPELGAESLLGRIGQSAVVNAGIGAADAGTRVNGQGGEQASIRDRLQAMLEGGEAAGAVGAIAPPLVEAALGGVNAARAGVRAGVNRFWVRDPEEVADNVLAARLDASDSSPAQVRLDLQNGQNATLLDQRGRGQSRATLPETIMDTNDDLRRLGGSVYRQGGEAGNTMKAGLDLRQRGDPNLMAEEGDTPVSQQARVLDSTRRALLIQNAESAHQTEAQLLEEQKAKGDALYEQGRQQSQPFDLQPVIDGLSIISQKYPPPFAAKLNDAIDLFTRPVKNGGAEKEAAAIQKIQDMMEDHDRKIGRMEPGPKLDQANEDHQVKLGRALRDLDNTRQANRVFSAKRQPIDNVENFDNAKKALDDKIRTARQGGENHLAEVLGTYKNALLEQVHADGKNPIYREARETWGSDAEHQNALQMGRDSLKEDSELTADHYNELPGGYRGAHQTFFRIGQMEALRNLMRSSKPGDDITKFFQQNRVRDLMRATIPNSEHTATSVFHDRSLRYGELLNREGRIVATRNQVLGGSPTQQRMADDANFAANTLAEMVDRFRHGHLSLTAMGYEALGLGLRRIFGYRQEVASALARRLLTTDRTEQNIILRRLRARAGQNTWNRFANHLSQMSTRLGTVAAPGINQALISQPQPSLTYQGGGNAR